MKDAGVVVRPHVWRLLDPTDARESLLEHPGPQHGYLGVQPRAGYSTGLLSQEYFDGCEPYYGQQEHPAESRASSGAVDISGSLL